ncbi:hypothetical protein BDV18DRAFT_130356 [Aspergillus unguis]
MSSASQPDSSSPSLTPITSSPGTDPPSESAPKDNTTDNNSTTAPFHHSAASYFSYPVTHVVSGLYRRFTEPPSTTTTSNMKSLLRRTNPAPSSSSSSISSTSQQPIFTPVRTVSPFQPPPLTPLTLASNEESTPIPLSPQNQLLTRALAEEIRLLVPPRLQLADTWRLAYSLDRDGASLSTLYENCRAVSARSPRAGYVLVIRDASPSNASVFGAYMTDPPHPDSHYFGTGECFLWRASVLPPPTNFSLLNSKLGASEANADVVDQGTYSEEALEKAGFPPPPSADTTNVGRSTTLRGEKAPKSLAPHAQALAQSKPSNSGATTPDRIRFKAFPYSGVNDYMMFCETGFLSLGGGDGHYGLWLDSILEKGVSASCQTFGNEPLSDEGVKFDVIGVEVWYVGS